MGCCFIPWLFSCRRNGGVGVDAVIKKLEFSLPMPPSVNTYYRSVSKGPLSGRVLISEAGRAYRKDVNDAVLVQRVKRIDGRLKLSVTLHFRDKRKSDLDNRIKSLQDALQKTGVFEDDSQIDELHVVRGEVIKGGLCLVKLEVIE